MADIDSLNIRINANASNADASIDTLIRRLSSLSTALSSIDASGLLNLSAGVTNLSSAVSTMSAQSNSTDAFKSLASNIRTLGRIDTGRITSAGVAIQSLASSVATLGGTNLGDTASRIADLSKAMSRLGGASAQRAITTIPLLANAMSQLMTTLSQAPVVSQRVVDLCNALANLSAQSRGVTTSSEELAPSLNRAKISFKSLKPHITGIASAFGKFYASCFLVIRAVKKLWSAIESSMNYVEVLNYFNSAMEQVTRNADLSAWKELGFESAQAYANSFSDAILSMSEKMTGYTQSASGMLINAQNAKSLGINATDLMNASTGFAQIASSMGVASSNAVKMSVVLTELGADLASVKNQDFTSVWSNLQSGVVGMSRAVDKYGVNIRNANLQTKLQNIGIETAVANLGQEEKALLRVIVMLESTEFAYGDLADTIKQPANQVRMLKSAMANLGRTIGNIFLPVVAQVIPYLISFANALERLGEYIIVLLGFEDFDWGSSSASGIEDLISDIYDSDDALDDATESAKDYKKALQGFDELNNITTKDSSGSTGLTPAQLQALQDAFDEAIENYQKRWDEAFAHMSETYDTFADNIAKAFKAGGLYGVGKYLSKSIVTALSKIDWKKAYKGAESFGTGLANFLNGLLTPSTFAVVGVTIANSLNTALHSAFSFGNTFNWKQFGEAIATGINKFIGNYDFKLLGKTMSTFAKGFLDTLISFFKNTDWESIGQAIGTWLHNLDWFSIVGKVAKVIYEALIAGFDLYAGVLTKSPVSTTIASAVGGLLLASNWSTMTTGITNVITSLKKFGTVGKKVFTLMVGSVSNVVTGVKLANAGFTEFAEISFNSISDSLSLVTKALGSAITLFAEFALVRNAVEGVALGTKNVALGIMQIVSAVAVASVALTALLGFPAGLIASGCALAVGAIVGVNDALESIKAESVGKAIHDAFSNPEGTSIVDLVDNVSSGVQTIVNSFSGVSKAVETVDDSNESIANVWREIDKIRISMDNGIISVEEGTQKLSNLFDELATVAETKFNAMNDVILSALGEGSALRIGLQMEGEEATNVIATSLGVTAEALSRIAEIQDALSTMDYSNPDYSELLSELAKLTGGTNDTNQAIADFEASLNGMLANMDWSDFFPDGEFDSKAFDEFLSSISESLKLAQDEVAEGYSQLQKQIEAEMELTTDPEKLATLQKVIDSIPNGIAYWDQYFADEAQQITDALQADLIDKIPQIIDSAKSDWDGNLWLQFFGSYNSSDAYAQAILEDYSKSVDEIDKGLKKMLDNLNSNGSVYAGEATKAILDNLFITERGEHASEKYVSAVSESVDDVIVNALSNIDGAYESYSIGGNIIKGIEEGIYGEKDDSKLSIEEVCIGMDSAIKEFWGIHSPSKVMYQYGIYLIEGLVNGISDKEGIAVSAIKAVANSVIKIVNDLIEKINTSLNFEVTVDGDVNTTIGVDGKKIPQYATGGMPEDGLFFANHNELVGKFSNGRTAVANNQQITDGIASAVYKAMSSAMGEASSETNVNISLEGDADRLFRVVQKSASNYNKRTGRSAFA